MHPDSQRRLRMSREVQIGLYFNRHVYRMSATQLPINNMLGSPPIRMYKSIIVTRQHLPSSNPLIPAANCLTTYYYLKD